MSINAQTHIIDSKDMLERLYKYESQMIDGCEFVFDVETDGVSEVVNNLYGMGLCFNEHKAFYIPWRRPDGTLIWSDSDQKEIADWLLNTAKRLKLIGHNIIFDILIIERALNISLVEYLYSDTILQKHTIDEEPPFALKELAVHELGEWADNAQDDLKGAVIKAGGKWTKTQKDMYLAPTNILGEYCCWDVLLTLKLFNIYQDRIISQGLFDLFYKDEVMDLYREVTIPMKRAGVRIDLPHFEKLSIDVVEDIKKYTDKIQKDIEDDVYWFTQGILDKEVPVKRKGSFPKALAEVLNVPVPITKAGKVTLSAKAIQKQRDASPKFEGFYAWLLEEKELEVLPIGEMSELLYDFKCDRGVLRKAQEKIFFSKTQHKDKDYVFNLASNDHLAHLLFEVHCLPIDPRKKTEAGKPQVNEEVLSAYAGSLGIIDDLLDLKKLNKLRSTYIIGILDRQIEGRIYPSMLQFGTTSGRFASRNPNCQNLPKVPEKDPKDLTVVERYTAAIRKGFIADEGCSFIDADYSALEPRCFSHVSGDSKLQELWAKGEDMYSRISIDVFDLDNVSADPSAANYLKKVDPQYRQRSKVFCLSITYGAEAGRIGQAMNCSRNEAQSIINRYLGAYPGLKSYMNRCDYEAKTTGMVKTQFGRIRHLPGAKSIYAIYGDDILDYQWAKKHKLLDVRRKMKNLLNNAKNFPIQGLAGHVINRAMIAISKRFKKENIPAYTCLMVHDQVIINCPYEWVDKAKKIVQDCLENTTKISVELIAEPEVAQNMAESH